MKFGLRLLPLAGGMEALLNWGVLAEEAGFDQVWMPQDAFMPESKTLATALALRTQRVGIGAMGAMGAPDELACHLATLDELSGGRALLAVGHHTDQMSDWTGGEAGDPLERTRETVELIRTLLRGEVARSEGVFTWSDECYLRFQPRRAHVPIYVAAFGPEDLPLSGAIGDGSFPPLYPPEAAAILVPQIIAGAVAAGRDLAEVDVAGCVWMSLSEQRAAAADTLRPMCAYYGRYLAEDVLATVGLSPADFAPLGELVDAGRGEEAAAQVTEEMLKLAIVGTPDDVIVQIERLAQLGVTQVNIGGPLGPNPELAIRLMGEQVIPHFRGA